MGSTVLLSRVFSDGAIMQLVERSGIILQDNVPAGLRDTLQDIASKVQIQADFCIRHPDYKPFDLSPEVVARFQKMPAELQRKHLSLLLCNFIYGIYYNGSRRKDLALEGDSNRLPLKLENLENNTLLGVDLAFFDRLHESNKGTGYLDYGWNVLREENDGSLAVTKGGLRLHVKRERDLPLSQQSAAVGDSVAVRMPKNLMQNGFYMAVGNAGSDSPKHEGAAAIVRIYFNFTPEGAVAVMGGVTEKLNEMAIPFSFKVLYNPGDYGRYDSGVLYFEKRDYEAIRGVLETVYCEHQGHFQAEVPLFTKWLAPGLGLGEEPNRKFGEQESFGINRCQIVAYGLLEAWHSGDDSPEGRMSAIQEQFSVLGIDLQRAYLNANSEDVYARLDLVG
jgi:hypothetical protein